MQRALKIIVSCKLFPSQSSITALFRCLVPRTFEKKLSDPALGTNNLQTGWVTVEYKMSLACTLASFYRHLRHVKACFEASFA